MKTLLILLTFITTHSMASSLFTTEELSEFKRHNFSMSVEKEVSREARPNRLSPMIHEFRAERATRDVKQIRLTRVARPARSYKEKKEMKIIKLAKLF